MAGVDPQRQILIRQAFRLEWLTVGWMAVEAAVALASGIAARSITLIAFGMDSVIELASAGVLIWRLSLELRFGREISEAAERSARRIAGGLLFLLAAYVVAAAGWSLWRGEGEGFSWPGLAIALLSIPIMLVLARRKRTLACQLGSDSGVPMFYGNLTRDFYQMCINELGRDAQVHSAALVIDRIAGTHVVPASSEK